jgi:nucleoside-diphosphate-sugar epimerase
MRTLVTGASGFLGGAVCAELGARGHEVSALVRRPGSEPDGTRPVPGDLLDETALSAAIAGAEPECIVHLAAEIASQRDESRIREVNVEGTRHLIAAAKAAGSPRIVFTSTVVTGEANGALLDETTPLHVETPYGRSKQDGERMLLQSGLPAIVLRPSHVYGAGGWYASDMVARLRQPGRFAVIGRGENLWDVVRVEDVATAVADAAERAQPGSLYHVADDEPITFYDFMALTAKALGVGPPRRIPRAVASLAAGRHTVTAVTRSARSDNSLIKRELGWKPRFPSAREGVPDAVAALLSAGA